MWKEKNQCKTGTLRRVKTGEETLAWVDVEELLLEVEVKPGEVCVGRPRDNRIWREREGLSRSDAAPRLKRCRLRTDS